MRTSELLTRLAVEPNERLTVGTILARLGDRSFALLIVILGLPNCIPMPPPIPLVCSLLLFGVAIQIALGRRAPWLPAYVRDNRSYLTVAVGCTGGQHRSVAITEWLAAQFRDQARVLVRHRSLAA